MDVTLSPDGTLQGFRRERVEILGELGKPSKGHIKVAERGSESAAIRLIQDASWQVNEEVARGTVVGPGFQKIDERAV